MADAFKVLAQGQLSNVAGTLYTVPGGKSVIVKSIMLREATGAGGPYTGQLYIGGTAAANTWGPLHSLANDESTEWSGSLALEAGQTIRGVASAASKISYTISGDEVT